VWGGRTNSAHLAGGTGNSTDENGAGSSAAAGSAALAAS